MNPEDWQREDVQAVCKGCLNFGYCQTIFVRYMVEKGWCGFKDMKSETTDRAVALEKAWVRIYEADRQLRIARVMLDDLGKRDIVERIDDARTDLTNIILDVNHALSKETEEKE